MSDEERRRELERAAFGETVPDAQRAEALKELSRLAKPGVSASIRHLDKDGRERVAATHGEPRDSDRDTGDGDGDGTSTGTAADSDGGDVPPTPGRRARGRLLIGGVLVVTLLVGGAAGALFDGTFRSAGHDEALQTVEPVPTSTADSAATSRLAAGDPPIDSPSGDPGQAADALLSRSATPADRYPFADGDADDYVDSSTRVVVTTVSQNSVWIAKKRGSGGGYCILTATGPAEALGITGATSCANPADFAARGLLIATGDIRATWRGDTVTVSVTN